MIIFRFIILFWVTTRTGVTYNVTKSQSEWRNHWWGVLRAVFSVGETSFCRCGLWVFCEHDRSPLNNFTSQTYFTQDLLKRQFSTSKEWNLTVGTFKCIIIFWIFLCLQLFDLFKIITSIFWGSIFCVFYKFKHILHNIVIPLALLKKNLDKSIIMTNHFLMKSYRFRKQQQDGKVM